MKTAERLRARELRAAGASVREIERELKVARSTASRWVADIQLTPDVRRALAARVSEGRLAVAERKRDAARALRRQYQAEGRMLVHTRGPSYVAGCMLYWAEGDKSRWVVGISNSDPALLRVFADFLREHFSVPDAAMRLDCNLFADHLDRQREIERFWLEAIGLSPDSLRRSAVNRYSKYSQKKRTNKLPWGTCRLRVHSTRIVQTILGSIQEYAGIERPEWLD